MSEKHRKFRHENGLWWLRSARTHEQMTPGEFAAWVDEQTAGGYEPIISSGVFVGWYSPKTDEETAADDAFAVAHKERTDKWERDTFARLSEKFAAETSDEGRNTE